MQIIPRDEKYFDLLNETVSRIHAGADLLVAMFDDIPQKAEYLRKIKDVEHECDQLSDSVVERLNSSFITPIDREDIYLLATELDDVMDGIAEPDRRLMSAMTERAPRAVSTHRERVDRESETPVENDAEDLIEHLRTVPCRNRGDRHR